MTTDEKMTRITALAKECARSARDAAGTSPTDADGNDFLADSPLPEDYTALKDLLDREPTAAEHEAFEDVYASATEQEMSLEEAKKISEKWFAEHAKECEKALERQGYVLNPLTDYDPDPWDVLYERMTDGEIERFENALRVVQAEEASRGEKAEDVPPILR